MVASIQRVFRNDKTPSSPVLLPSLYTFTFNVWCKFSPQIKSELVVSIPLLKNSFFIFFGRKLESDYQ